MKIIVGDQKSGRTYAIDVPKDREVGLYGMKVGDVFDGSMIGVAGYKMRITGGSDKDGFPMRADVQGIRKIKVIIFDKPGYRQKEKGIRKRKIVRGNTVSEFISQLNVIPVKIGPTPIDQILGKKEEKKEGEEKGEEKRKIK